MNGDKYVAAQLIKLREAAGDAVLGGVARGMSALK
jgi:hypothetical protein